MKRTAMTLCVAALTALSGCAGMNRDSRCACCHVEQQQTYSTYPGASQ